jgi:hypothetical protein
MNTERILLWGLTIIVLGMTFLLNYLGDMHAKVVAEKDVEIAMLMLKVDAPPDKVELSKNSDTGDVVIRIHGEYYYSFPKVCPPSMQL